MFFELYTNSSYGSYSSNAFLDLPYMASPQYKWGFSYLI